MEFFGWIVLLAIICIVGYSTIHNFKRNLTLPYEAYLQTMSETEWKDRRRIMEEVDTYLEKELADIDHILTLKQLLEEGLVEQSRGIKDVATTRINVQYYKLTSKGRNKLQELREQGRTQHDIQPA